MANFEFPASTTPDEWAKCAERLVENFDLDFEPDNAILEAIDLYAEGNGDYPNPDLDEDFEWVYTQAAVLLGFDL
jgi:hypothetical protein